MTGVIKVLVIDDDEDDYVLVRDLLTEAFGEDLQLGWESAWDEALEKLIGGEHDVCLVDYRLGARNGLHLIAEAVARGCSAPLILLTGQGSREVDLEAMTAGASDYLVKGEISAPLLERAIRYAIERKKIEARLARLSLEDSLTKLPNRTLFDENLERTISLARREERCFSVIMLDLNKFKEVNDTLGHNAGDSLLEEVAARIRSVMRESDMIARLGGDEFAAILPTSGSLDGAAVVAEKIIRAVERPISLGSDSVDVGASVGIAFFPEHGTDAATVLSHADAAMYEAKRSGSGYAVYGAAQEETPVQSAVLTGRIRQAIEQDELVVFHQPKLHMQSGGVVGVEALVRWRSPEFGSLEPHEFIPAAEKTAVIKPLTLAMLRKVLEQAFALRESGLELTLAVNLSARVLHDWELPGQVVEALEQWSMPPDMLILEISESGLMRDADRVMEVVTRLASIGVRISIDDFGNGYTSFRHLKSLPVKEIKIHESFIANLTASAKDQAIVRSVIALCNNLEITVVANGVREEATWELLTQLGCHVGQGLYVSRPLSPEGFLAWMPLWSPAFELSAGSRLPPPAQSQ